MRSALAAPILIVAVVTALVGCSAGAPEPTMSAPSSASSSQTGSGTADPVVSTELVVTVDGLTVEEDGAARSVSFAAGDDLVALVTELAGDAPSTSPVPAPDGSDAGFTRYEWDGVALTLADGRAFGFSVDVADLHGTPVRSVDGFAVGSAVDELRAAGAWEVWSDGATTELGHAGREVPGTESLDRPGEVGIEFVLFRVADGVVTEILAPANDFADV